MMDEYFLVNVVHNDFKDPGAIFRPFFDISPPIVVNGTPAKMQGVPNGNGIIPAAPSSNA